MANSYSHTALTHQPDDFRLNPPEIALLEHMGFDVRTCPDGGPDHVFSHEGAHDLTLEDLKDELGDTPDAIQLADAIIEYRTMGPCYDDIYDDATTLDYADLLTYALHTRKSDGFVQVSIAYTSDRSRVDACGGGACHITAHSIEHVTTRHWLDSMANAHNQQAG